MLTSSTRAWVEIDLSKIAHNVEEVRNLIPSTSKIMGIVKANAYGHGDIACTKELVRCGIDFFGVSSVDEAIALREAGIEANILILGYTPPLHIHLIMEYDLIQTILSLNYAQKINDWCKQHECVMKGHVKLDTGMSRLGVVIQKHEYHIDEVKSIYHMPYIDVCGIFSHFSVSDLLDDVNKAFTDEQVQMFEKALQDLKADGIDVGLRHIQNSYGILNYPDLAYDYVRPGLLYMGATSDDAVAINSNPDFWPIMQLKANVSLVKTIQPGVSVSYGRNFQSESPRRIATISIGYADGYPRNVSNRGSRVLIHGEFAPIIGNICMDQMMIDISDIDDVVEGDVVTLIGTDGEHTIKVDELSRLAGTINNETFCWISSRVPRIYK